MKVMRFNDSAETPALIAGESPIPRPQRGELLIRVMAAGVTPTELQWYPTTHTKEGGVRMGAIPGHELSGVIEEVGEGVAADQIGREVFGMNDWFSEGATAEYCITAPAAVGNKPERLSHAEAASVPIGALTAWQGLFDHAKLRSGESVLIHGGAGAVGVFAIQLAKRAGARVITTASARNAEFLRALGADEIIDYRSARFEEHVSGVDVVFDGVGGATLERSWPVLKPAGRMVTIATGSSGAEEARTKAAFFIVEPNQGQLTELAGLLDRGELRAVVDGIAPLAEASAVYLGRGERTNGRGKMVIAVSGSAI